MVCKGINFVKYAASPEMEKQSAPYKNLNGAVVLVPEGTALSETALTTIRHLRYYQNGNNVTMLLSDSAGVLMDADSLEQLIDAAEDFAGEVCGSMPDFTPYSMDDGCSVVLMKKDAFGFRPHPLADVGFPVGALEVRQDILDACNQFDVLAVVYNNGKDYEKYCA